MNQITIVEKTLKQFFFVSILFEMFLKINIYGIV